MMEGKTPEQALRDAMLRSKTNGGGMLGLARLRADSNVELHVEIDERARTVHVFARGDL